MSRGIHHLFNVVTGPAEAAHAVLIRGVEPVEGVDVMLIRRKFTALKPQLTAGPGVLSKALGLHKRYDATSLIHAESPIWLADAPVLTEDKIVACPRIGIDYAEECADWPWRFYERDSRWVSKRIKAETS